MPGLSGFSLLEKMKESENTKRIPVLLMSATEKSDNSANTALKKGGADYIFKPIVPSILLRRVKKKKNRQNIIFKKKIFYKDNKF